MNQTSKKRGISLRPGNVVIGKWHKKRYMIKKQLGMGAIGTVYLCEHNGKYAALKISDKDSSVTMEVNVLKTFQKVQGNRLGPSLLDVDDWIDPKGKRYSFYVMEYLKGKELSTFVRSQGEEWLIILMIQLLGDLEKLHNEGWVFGDLKTENLLVTSPPPKLRWIDVGGTTQIGRSIKEYTEFYDRGYWNMGTRKAEPSYDLFALVMVMMQFYHPKRFERGTHPEKTLIRKLQQTPQLKLYEPSLMKALKGQYITSKQMKDDLLFIIMKRENNPNQQKQGNHKPMNQVLTRSQQRDKSKPKPSNDHPIFESFAIFAVVLAFYFMYLVLS